jgi:NADH-quinone oxidoreductase subunit J
MTLPTLQLLAAARLEPVVIILLCAVAGIGTMLLLPSRREVAVRRIGGTILFIAALVLVSVLFRYAAGSPDAPKGGMGPYFWLFSAIAVFAAVRVITHARPVYSALYFVLTVLASAGLFILLAADFMAAALVVIYAGAILVTYVFVIMLASQSATVDDAQTGGGLAALMDYDTVAREPFFASAIGFTLAGVLLFVIFDRVPAITPAPTPGEAIGTTFALGTYLFSQQIVTLELAGLILTLAMVGAIVIARHHVFGTGAATGPEVLNTPATPITDDPHSIPVYGTDNPAIKAYPER